ncbi:PP2C family protein-serine/threonine phosphatase [Actinomadura flavalba]|uniref:PP2C family protein-serine/threonine phosphatase n=1 Tax=Actinomadura flavalba TaxID=1120938 RepID=UPI001F0A8012|nr:PP2C family protein-serine/threonine phosphatase [Actinomadura flavalba]
MVDVTGTITESNTAARVLFQHAGPGTPLDGAVPAWLSRAHAALTRATGSGADGEVAHGTVGDRVYEAYPSGPDEHGRVVWWLADDTEHRLAAEALRLERERTEFLVEASNSLLSSLNLDRCTEVTARLAARHLADAALVITPAVHRRHPVVYCGPDGEPVRDDLAVDPAQVPGLAEALQGFPPMPSRWIDPAAAPAWVVREGFGAVGSMVVTSLPGHGVPAGALILLRRTEHAAFSEGEEVFARLFAGRAGAAMSAAGLYAEQTSITETLMRELLPPRVQEVDGVELAAGYRPSGEGERVGGDFYDVHPRSAEGEESLVVLGDVCGKGLEAAVLTGKIRTTLQALLPMAADHGRVLRLLNGTLLNGERTRFVTLVLTSVRRTGDGVELRLTSAGHPAPFVVRADRSVEPVPSKGTLIGVLDEIVTTTVTVTLAPGETCLLYTDGITEVMGGPLGDEMFGEARLREELEQCAGMPARALVERVQMLAAQWVGTGHHDDMAVVAISAPAGRKEPA